MKHLWPLPILLLATPLARAAPADCAAMPLEVWIDLPKGVSHGQTGVARVGLGDIPATGPNCPQPTTQAATEPVTDILHGASAPHGLLRGDGPRDVLHDVRDGHVTIRPTPP